RRRAVVVHTLRDKPMICRLAAAPYVYPTVFRHPQAARLPSAREQQRCTLVHIDNRVHVLGVREPDVTIRRVWRRNLLCRLGLPEPCLGVLGRNRGEGGEQLSECLAMLIE